MENKKGSGFTELVLIISDISIMASAYWIFGYSKYHYMVDIGFIPWLVFTLATLLFYRLFMHCERTFPQVVAFLAVSYAVTDAALLLFFVHLSGLLEYIVLAIFWGIPLFRIYSLTEKEPTLEKLVIRFEILVLLLLVVIAFVAATENIMINVLPCAVSVLLCLINLIIIRTSGGTADGSHRIRGLSVMLALFVFFAAAVAVFILFISLPVGDAVKLAAQAVFSGVKYVFSLISRLFSWLVSLLPKLNGGNEIPLPGGQSSGSSNDTNEIENVSPIVVFIILCAIAITVIIFIVLAVVRLRRKRIGGVYKKSVSRINKKRLHGVIAMSLRHISDSARFFIDSIIYRNTPQGVLVYIEHWGSLHRMGRFTGETHRHYLACLAAVMPERADSLQRLSDALDAKYYSALKSSDVPKRELATIRRSFVV